MVTQIGNKLRITDPSPEIIDWCKENLVIPNPEYAKKKRMGLWTGRTAPTLILYEWEGNTLVLPFGCLRAILGLLEGDLEKQFKKAPKVFYGGNSVPLYDYQEEAVAALLIAHYGILQAPAGCGKTQMGISLACKLGVRTLWLTHTKDLLNQSKTRAEKYIDPKLLGTITEGMVNVGEFITFATVQTMCRVDLDEFRDTWDCVIVDECHRVSGTPTAVTQFSKVLNSLRARHKYGMSATVHRADGLIKATYALMGPVVYTVPEEAVKDRIMQVTVFPRGTGVTAGPKCFNSDGTVNYSRLITYLTEHDGRNQTIMNDLLDNRTHSCLILSDRVDHLKDLYGRLPAILQKRAAVIDGKMTSKSQKALREQALEDMRTGEKRFLFATYALAKEGLDIPRLDRLFLTTPQKDYAVIVQSIGRIDRAFEGKQFPTAYDYVDNIRLLEKSYKKRCTHYKKCGCRLYE